MSGWWLASYVILWVVTVAMFVVLLVVLRQLGLMYMRGGGAPRLEEGPPIGAIIPRFEEAEDVGGAEISFPDELAELSFLLFTSPRCRICEDALRGIAEITRDFDVRVVVVSEGDAEQNRRLREIVDGGASFTSSPARQRILQVHTHPYGVVTDRDGIVLDKGVVNGTRDLEVLLQAARSSVGADAEEPAPEGGG